MGLRLGPSAEAAAGPFRSWLLSSVNQATQAWSTAQLATAERPAADTGPGARRGVHQRCVTLSERIRS